MYYNQQLECYFLDYNGWTFLASTQNIKIRIKEETVESKYLE